MQMYTKLHTEIIRVDSYEALQAGINEKITELLSEGKDITVEDIAIYDSIIEKIVTKYELSDLSVETVIKYKKDLIGVIQFRETVYDH